MYVTADASSGRVGAQPIEPLLLAWSDRDRFTVEVAAVIVTVGRDPVAVYL